MIHLINPSPSSGLCISLEFCRGGERINSDQDQRVYLTHVFEHPRLVILLKLVAGDMVKVEGSRANQKTTITVTFMKQLIEDGLSSLGK